VQWRALHLNSIRYAWLDKYEISSTACTGLNFARHSHDECVIGVNLLGEEKVWLDRRTFSAGAGNITLYNPGQIQGGGAAPGTPWRFVSLYVSAGQLATDLGLEPLEFGRALCYQPQLAEKFARAVEQSLLPDPLLRAIAEETLVVLLGEIVALSGLRLPGTAAVGRGLVNRTQEIIAERLQAPQSLEELSDEFGLSKFHLLRAFQRETGLSPRQWAMQLRTRRAQGLLRKGAAPGDIAYTLGFTDQSHLNRHFKAAYGLTPGRYQSAVKR